MKLAGKKLETSTKAVAVAIAIALKMSTFLIPPSLSTSSSSSSSSSSSLCSEEVFNLDEFLQQNPSAKDNVCVLVNALRRRKLSGNIPCAKATLKVLFLLIGSCKFASTHIMMEALRSIGRLLLSVSPSELSIGNIIRRVLYLIREEYSTQLRYSLSKQSCNYELPTTSHIHVKKERKPRSHSMSSTGSTGSQDNDNESIAALNAAFNLSNLHAPNPNRAHKIDIAPQQHQSSLHLKPPPASKSTDDIAVVRPISPGSPLKRIDSLITVLSPADLLDPSQQPSLGSVLCQADVAKGTAGGRNDFSKTFPNMRQNILAVINELSDEIDTVYDPICKEAKDHIHADECILAYGYSVTVEMFLKGAARKRRFQLIIAEGGPGNEGHKLALSLSSLPNISSTLIPDSGIYAIMCRVNKVILSPHSVMADGGAICTSGHLMVAIAAKEFSVPVVGVTSSFSLTPLFGHNQSLALGELLCPASIIPYNSPVNFQNIEVISPAFDFITPDLMTLYVTNSGTHQPSYIYRLLSEFYHPNDHNL